MVQFFHVTTQFARVLRHRERHSLVQEVLFLRFQLFQLFGQQLERWLVWRDLGQIIQALSES